MQYSDKIELLTDEPHEDTSGYKTHNFTHSRVVWADAHSVGRTEFYKAASIKKRVTFAFDVHPEDYRNELYVRFKGKVYTVLRAYQKSLGDWELNCTDEADWGEFT